ncbi:hypothetical protein [Rosistilla oblonga]|uniref:hypothetical protein n=1 Tax=Rosistilla oblonga TaxID=2527990 RepID=UPI003A96AB61
MSTRCLTTCILLAILCNNRPVVAQEGSFLDAIRQRIQSAADNQTEAEKEQTRKKLESLFSIVTEGAREIYRTLPDDSQKAIDQRRQAWMDAMASGVDDLTGDDIERWLDNSDNVILRSLSRGGDAPSVNAQSRTDLLPEQWWYGKQNRTLAQLLTQPPETIIRREDLPGPPIWFVNGITTKRAEAIAMADEIAEQLGRRVHLLHNPTFMEPPNHSGLDVEGYGTDDLSECLHDRLWPATVFNKLNRMDAEQLQAMRDDGQTLQGNPTTRQLAYVLLTAREPISLITHSQGCIIARNAMYTMAMLGRREQAEQQIAWIAAGIPLNDKELSPLPLQTTILDVGDDPIAKIVGMRGGSREYRGTDHSFSDHYCRQIQAEQLWHDALPATDKPAVPPAPETSTETKPDAKSPKRVKL